MYQIVFENTAGTRLIDRIAFQTLEAAKAFAESCKWIFKDETGKRWNMRVVTLPEFVDED